MATTALGTVFLVLHHLYVEFAFFALIGYDWAS
jgi:hypothetical protein